jgi:hypothetical protein
MPVMRCETLLTVPSRANLSDTVLELAGLVRFPKIPSLHRGD